MQFLRYIGDFIWRGLRMMATPIVALASLIAGAITGFCSFIYSVFTGSFGVFTTFFNILDKFDSLVTAFNEYLNSNPYWGFFYDLFALDIFAESLSYFLSIFVVVSFLSLFGFFFAGLTSIVPFLIIKALRSGVSVATGGFIKP